MAADRTQRTRCDANRFIVPHAEPIQTPGPKPTGLWYELGGDWRRWCASDQPDWIDGKFLHGVVLDGERMLVLRGVGDIDAFHARYALPAAYPMDGRYVDWTAVATGYDGIEIAPYCWERRLEGSASRWYYGWDCASGCIWRPRAMRVELVEGPLRYAAR